MSGGEKKKRASKGAGWEEAKDEFYQESYPTDADLDNIERDPKKIATYLPSKQTRGTTTKRYRTKDGKGKNTVRRRPDATTTIRRHSVTQENYVAMMPDLSEAIANEETTWEEIMDIKSIPITLAQKRERKERLKSATKLRLQGCDQFKWKSRKFFQTLKTGWQQFVARAELWDYSLRQIEGSHGTGVVTYFQFIKWLIFLNFGMFLLLLVFIVIPPILLDSVDGCSSNNTEISHCLNSPGEQENTTLTKVLDFIQGTGWMEDTITFYGKYHCGLLVFPDTWHFYNLPFAYILVTLSALVLSLVCIVRSAARGFRERLMEGEGQYYQFCNLVFGGWDFCIDNEKAARMKHKALFNEIRAHLLEERLEEEAKQRSTEAATKLFLVRAFTHVVVLIILAGSAALIYVAFSFSKTELEQSSAHMPMLLRLLLEYLPSITIVALNSIVPFILRYLVTFEKYSPLVDVRMTLFRTVLLRLASLIVLICTLYSLVSCKRSKEEDCDKGCQPLRCWENYVGQNFYKLLLLNFATHFVMTFFVNFPRMLIGKHGKSRLAKLIGEQEFSLPSHVLDVIYTQSLCWLGVYFAPILPAMTALELIILFYLKKFACLINSVPSPTVHLASRSKSLFMTILLVSFVVAVAPVALSIGEVSPSALCGPFRGNKYIWDVVVAAFETLPSDLKNIIFFIGSAGFAVPAFVILALALYYYSAVSQANKHMVTVLKNQLVLEGHDKQFLLNRLSALVRERSRKLARSLPPESTENSTN